MEIDSEYSDLQTSLEVSINHSDHAKPHWLSFWSNYFVSLPLKADPITLYEKFSLHTTGLHRQHTDAEFF